MPTERRNEIQWLRAIAAFEVVVCHSDLIIKNFSDSRIILNPWYNPVAGMGVELFFIVSGYIMAMRSPKFSSTRSFISSRILRIIPMYWIFTTLVVLVGIVVPGWRLGDFEPSLAVFARAYLILPGSGFPILGVGWTLEYEVVFYGLVALLLAFGLARGRRLASAAWIFVGLGWVGSVLGPLGERSALLGHVFTPYMFAFGAGWLFRCLEQAPRPVQLRRLAWLAAIAASAVWLGPDWGDRLILRIGVAVVVFAACLLGQRVLQADTPVNRLIWLAGDASFSTYLCHWLLLSATGKLLGALAVPESWGWSLRLLGCLLSVAVGIAFFRTVEQHIPRWLRSGAPAFLRGGQAERPAL